MVSDSAASTASPPRPAPLPTHSPISAAADPPTPTVKPNSFSLAALHADDFDPQAFIADRRQHAPLSLLRDELRTYVSSLSSQIVHALQKDFNLFTNFGPSLSDATVFAQSLAPALVDLHTNLNAIHAHLQSHADTLHVALARRHDIHNRRLALQTLVAAHDSLVKCERLLRQFTPLSANPLADPALSLLDRITAETAQLSFTLNRAHTCIFLDSLSVRISAVKRQVRTSLDQCLSRALPHPKPFDPDVLARVLALYVVAGMHDDAHDFFTRHIVTPFTSSRIRMGLMLSVAERRLAKGSDKNPVTPGDALRSAHDEIVTFLGDRVLPVVTLCSSDPRLARRLDFVGKSVWPNIQRAIASNMTPAFSPGIPDVFHRSFQAGVSIFSAIESASSNDFRDALRRSPVTAEFWKHWNLPVYFQLRFQEISSGFETKLANGPISPDASAIGKPSAATSSGDATRSAMDSRLLRTDVYKAGATCELVGALRRCWAEDVFLGALTHRFVRLCLQLLARYATWVRTGLAGEWPDQENVAKGAARVVHDVTVLQTRLPAELASVLSVRCPGVSAEGVEMIETAFAEAVERYAGLVPELQRSIGDALAKKCVENLQPLRGIIATYRMSSKQAPTTHSSFVPKILRPLRVFLKEQEGTVDAAGRRAVAKAVVEQTAKEYLAMATELVERNKSNEATLRRLNIGRSGGAVKGSSGMSVVEKISVQLYLDVEQFTDEVGGVGVVVEEVEGLRLLRESVKREREEKDGGKADDGIVELQ